MPADRATLAALIERGSGANVGTDVAVWSAVVTEAHEISPFIHLGQAGYVEGRRWHPVPKLTASVDEVFKLGRRLLPGFCFQVRVYVDGSGHGLVWDDEAAIIGEADAPNPARALLAALLRALMETAPDA